jgi:hypothetical protein
VGAVFNNKTYNFFHSRLGRCVTQDVLQFRSWDILELEHFGSWDVLRLWTFWGLGCFGVGTFYRWDLMQWDVLWFGRF